MELDEFRKAFDDWLDEHADELAPDFEGGGTLDEHMAQIAKVRRLTFDAGWARYGWPEQVGGLGGPTLLRAYLSEALTARDLVYSGVYSMPEVLGPSFITFAPPELSAAMLPPLLRGDEVWCQGFSEPGTGSNLGVAHVPSGAHRRRMAGHRPEGVDEPGAVLAALRAAHAHRHARVGAPGHHRALRRHGHAGHHRRGRSRPCTASREFCEVFFDDVLVPFDRTLGEEGDGWAFAMDLLPYERSTSLWQRAAFLHRRLAGPARRGRPGLVDPAKLGEVTQLVYAFRARSRATAHRMASGGVARARRRRSTRCCSPPRSRRCSTSWPTRCPARSPSATTSTANAGAASSSTRGRRRIYGGSSEIQRNIIARRLLDLGNDR